MTGYDMEPLLLKRSNNAENYTAVLEKHSLMSRAAEGMGLHPTGTAKQKCPREELGKRKEDDERTASHRGARDWILHDVAVPQMARPSRLLCFSPV